MFDRDFTPQMARELYTALEVCDEQLAAKLVMTALEQTANTLAHLVNDGAPMFDENDVKEQAASYVRDVMDDFTNMLVRRIESKQFSMDVKVQVSLND